MMANPLHPLYEDSDDDDDDELLPRQVHHYKERMNFDVENAFFFNEKFRLKRDVFDNLLQRVQEYLEHPTNRSFCLSSRQQILLSLHWLGCGAQLHVIADAHGISKATMCRTLKKVVQCINAVLFNDEVKWPANVAAVVEQFFGLAGMPCVVGCMDGTLINIDAPSDNEVQFVDRHGKHSITCMVVCGPNREFYYVSAKWPGSVHDARVLRTSTLFREMEAGWRPYPDAVILGDSAYPLKPWLLTPMFRNLDNPVVQRFNVAHKSTRFIVENSFGILKEKFPCLNYLWVDPVYACEIFKACIVLCNLSKDLDINHEPVEPPVDQEPDDEEPPEPVAEARLQQILQHFR